MNNEFEPLTPEDIRMFHDYALQKFGGIVGETEKGLIDSLANKPFDEEPFSDPRKELYPGLTMKAAVYMYTLATNQYFRDGNKRTAYISAASFLQFNGYILNATDDEMYYVSKLVSNHKNKVLNTGWDLPRLREWMTTNVVPVEHYTDEMRENKLTSEEIKKEFEIMEMVFLILKTMEERLPKEETYKPDDIDIVEMILSTATKSLFDRPLKDIQRRFAKFTGINLDAKNMVDMQFEDKVLEAKLLDKIFVAKDDLKNSLDSEYHQLEIEIDLARAEITRLMAQGDFNEAEQLRKREQELMKKLRDYDNQ
ncbi:Fic family protein [Bacillus sp. ILBB4]|nr:Fic family protein [Bacillus sp. ILBB4]